MGGELVFIWSEEHRAYWRPDGCGYTNRISQAGVYTRDDAEARTGHCGPEKRIELERLTPALAKHLAPADPHRVPASMNDTGA